MRSLHLDARSTNMSGDVDHPSTLRGSASDNAAVLLRACVLIPAVMLVVSGVLFAAQMMFAHMGQQDVPWSVTYFKSNIHAAYHAFKLAEADSWDPMWRARLWLATNPGKDVYEALFFQVGVKFQYPVSSLLFLEWLPLDARDPIRILNALNLGIFLLLVVGMVLLMLTLVDRARAAGAQIDRRNRSLLAALAAIATVCFYPALWSLQGGQIQMLLNVWFVFACRSYVRGGSTTAGILMGLSTLIKPQMAPFLVWGLLRRDMRFTTGWAASVVVGLVASAVAYGPTWPIGYLHVLSFIGSHGESYYLNQSVNGLLNRLLENGTNLNWCPGWIPPKIFPPQGPVVEATAVRWPQLHWQGSPFPPYHPIVHAGTLAATGIFTVAGLACGLHRWSAGRPGWSLAVAGLCFTMASPVAWTHHYGVLLPAFAFCLVSLLSGGRESNLRGRSAWVMLAVTYLIAANSWSMTNWVIRGPFSLLQSYVFFAAIATLGLMWTLCKPLVRTPAAEATKGCFRAA